MKYAVACGSDHSGLLKEDGSFEFFGNDQFGQCTRWKNIDTKVAIQVACGYSHSAVLYLDGTFEFFG